MHYCEYWRFVHSIGLLFWENCTFLLMKELLLTMYHLLWARSVGLIFDSVRRIHQSLTHSLNNLTKSSIKTGCLCVLLVLFQFCWFPFFLKIWLVSKRNESRHIPKVIFVSSMISSSSTTSLQLPALTVWIGRSAAMMMTVTAIERHVKVLDSPRLRIQNW